jgi:homoisocitrate dehydrogenase
MARTAYRVCAIEGDGIGREVIPAALQVLEATGLALTVTQAEAGWACFQSHGTALPEVTVETASESDAVLFGAVSSPSHKVEGYQSPIVALRRRLGLYANLRPAHSWPIPTSRPGIDLLIVRENSEGLYIQQERREGASQNGSLRAIADRVITQTGSARIAHVACRLAQRRKGHLTVVHKANVLPETDGLFRETVLSVAETYDDLDVDELLVDAAALRLVTDPDRFDVLVCPNLFGDILSDEAAGLVGGLGLAPSANVGSSRTPALFEPVHGSAPDIAGQGIANPLAAFLAVAMMLEHFTENARAKAVREAVGLILRQGPHTPDLGGEATTSQITNMVESYVGDHSA